jgi:hypothetical protein
MEISELCLKIPRFINESNVVYQYRLQYVYDNMNTSDLSDLIKRSKIESNIYFKKCKYDTKITNKL